jgi:hypothetical protein
MDLWAQPLTVRAMVVCAHGALGSVDTQQAGSETGTEETITGGASQLMSSWVATAATRLTTVARTRLSIIDTAVVHGHTAEHCTTRATRPWRAAAVAARRGMR